MAIVKSTSDKSLSLNVQHDYITLRTPNGNFTSSFGGAKASGNLVKGDSFNVIDKFVQTKVKTMSYGDAMALLLDPKTLTKLWKGWNAEVKKNEFKVDDVVKFTSPMFTKKYGFGKFTVVKVAKKYVYIKVTEKDGRVSNVGFDYTELVNA